MPFTAKLDERSRQPEAQCEGTMHPRMRRCAQRHQIRVAVLTRAAVMDDQLLARSAAGATPAILVEHGLVLTAEKSLRPRSVIECVPGTP
jgi:hypothetical protein